ncbi:hypothetical protein B0H67DRAFT_494616 [Lasiosphaeris hirsuta]|uniref:PLL-like beta propeller domain-containing protein n=1 Tax=Lasiosphaeris hirsuta TaxID=260670 RepID=A0AA40A2C7_9PEZI|nr:hypothetical protein B0H67DRAFT_494616 [Lasiosphaeris hirsuta]
MLVKLGLLLGSAGLALSLPSSGQQTKKISKRFIVEPRASHVDWNAPRHHGGFLSKRSDVHTEDYFNNPPSLFSLAADPETVKRDVVMSEDLDVAEHNNTKRAKPGQWESLDGSCKYHPAPVCWGGKRMDLYYMGKDKTCYHKSRDYGAKEPKQQEWGSWENLGGEMDSAPAVCTRKKENMHVFCKGTDNQAWHRSYWNGWGKWQAMGGKMKHEPAACSWGKDHAAVYVAADDGQCWHRRYDEPKENSGSWKSWESLGGYLSGPPKAVTWGKDHTSVICKGDDGQAWHKKTDPKKPTGWGEWETLGGSLDSTPAACAWPGDDRVDIFVKGSDGACWHKTMKNETVTWGAWENMGGEMMADTPPDVAVVDGGMEVYITGEDSTVYRKKWKEGSWTEDWEKMGGNVETKPSTVTWDDGKVDVYFTGKDSTVKRCF